MGGFDLHPQDLKEQNGHSQSLSSVANLYYWSFVVVHSTEAHVNDGGE